ncbi:MAG TPA: type II toxin-antitoxin system Phd/YefM family antitoxin [Chloroflexota bacterium]|jgi:prevent-host-death family protein
MAIVNMHEAKTHLSRLVERVEQGEEVLIARNGKPVAKLVRLAPDTQPAKRPLGLMRGLMWLPDDFDEEDPEIIEMFYGDDPEDPLFKKE